MVNFLKRKNIIVSLIAAAFTWLIFWGITIFIAIVGGKQPQNTFPGKAMFFLFILALQYSLAITYPLRSRSNVVLRARVATVGIVVSGGWLIWSLFALKLIGSNEVPWWILLDALLGLGGGVCLFFRFKDRTTSERRIQSQ